MRRNRVVAVVAVLLVLVAAAALAGRPGDGGRELDPASTDPDGTRALVLLLRELGASVEVVDAPPADADVTLLLRDREGDDGDAARVELLAWARAGGTLVVADPRSPLTPEVADLSFGELTGVTLDRGQCDLDGLEGVDAVEPTEVTLYVVPAGARSCFGSGSEAFVVRRAEGDGVLVAVGNATAWVNESLGNADGAVLAVALLAPVPGTRVAVLPLPPPGRGDERLVDLVPDNVRRLLVQLGIAFVVFALWRGRRLGRPVAEQQPVEIAGSELTRATGALLQQRRDPAAAATTLQTDLRTAIAARLGLPPGTPTDAVAEAVASRTGMAATVVHAALDAPVGNDAALVEVAHRLDEIRTEVLT